MKKTFKLFLILLLVSSFFVMTGCDLLSSIFGGDKDNVYTASYEPITGKFFLYETADERIVTFSNTYFDIDGSKGNFSLKYYENGVLKKEGTFQKIVARPDRVGYQPVPHY